MSLHQQLRRPLAPHSQVTALKDCLLSLLIYLLVPSAASETVSSALSYVGPQYPLCPLLRLWAHCVCSFLLWYSTQKCKPKRNQKLTKSLAKIDSLISVIDQRCLTWMLFCVKYSGGTLCFRWVCAPYPLSLTCVDGILRSPTFNNDQRLLQRLFYPSRFVQYCVQLPKFADDPMINLSGVVVLLNIMYGDGRPHTFTLNFSKWHNI